MVESDQGRHNRLVDTAYRRHAAYGRRCCVRGLSSRWTEGCPVRDLGLDLYRAWQDVEDPYFAIVPPGVFGAVQHAAQSSTDVRFVRSALVSASACEVDLADDQDEFVEWLQGRFEPTPLEEGAALSVSDGEQLLPMDHRAVFLTRGGRIDLYATWDEGAARWVVGWIGKLQN